MADIQRLSVGFLMLSLFFLLFRKLLIAHHYANYGLRVDIPAIITVCPPLESLPEGLHPVTLHLVLYPTSALGVQQVQHPDRLREGHQRPN